MSLDTQGIQIGWDGNASEIQWTCCGLHTSRCPLSVNTVDHLISETQRSPAARPAAALSSQSDPAQVWVVSKMDTPAIEALVESVESGRNDRSAVVRLLQEMNSRAETGKDLALAGQPGDAASDSQYIGQALRRLDATVADARDEDVADGDTAPPPEAASAAPRESPDAREEVELRLAAFPPMGPTEFDFRGFEKNNARSWEVKIGLDAALCSRDGCYRTDEIRQTWTITPGRHRNQLTYRSLYVQGSAFSNIWNRAYALCYRSLEECNRKDIGRSGGQTGTGNNSLFITHPSLEGAKGGQRIQLRATFRPESTTYFDGIRTGTYNCRTGENFDCLFV